MTTHAVRMWHRDTEQCSVRVTYTFTQLRARGTVTVIAVKVDNISTCSLGSSMSKWQTCRGTYHHFSLYLARSTFFLCVNYSWVDSVLSNSQHFSSKTNSTSHCSYHKWNQKPMYQGIWLPQKFFLNLQSHWERASHHPFPRHWP